MARALGSNPWVMQSDERWPGAKHIIFDFGGVLFDIDYLLPIEAFERLGYPGFADLYTQAAQNQWFDELETGRLPNEAFYQYLHNLVSQATRTQVADAWNCILLDLRVDEVRFVQTLKNAGVRTFLLSNTNAIHVAEFEQMIDSSIGLPAFYNAFEHIYYSNVIGIKKPYPETFLAVCEWNNLKPEETLFIDDSIQHVQGAAEAGLHVHHLQSGERISKLLAEFSQRV